MLCRTDGLMDRTWPILRAVVIFLEIQTNNALKDENYVFHFLSQSNVLFMKKSADEIVAFSFSCPGNGWGQKCQKEQILVDFF